MHFDFHHHSSVTTHFGLKNIRLGHSEEGFMDASLYSIGIHPWDIKSIDLGKALTSLDGRLNDPKYMALGELGFDKNFGTNLDIQKEVFRSQLALAEKHQKKVLIIHCVKAFQEIIEEKMKTPYLFKWVLHGFNGSADLIQQLINHDFYFSIGALLFKKESKIAHHLHLIPLDRIFFETDESNFGIDEVYQQAAEILNIEESKLEFQVELNLKQLFEEKWPTKNQ